MEQTEKVGDKRGEERKRGEGKEEIQGGREVLGERKKYIEGRGGEGSRRRKRYKEGKREGSGVKRDT